MDVDSLSRRFGTLTTKYIQVATLLSNSDKKARSAAYTPRFKNSSQATKIPVSPHLYCAPLLILTATVLQSATPDNIDPIDALCPASLSTLSSVPMMLHLGQPNHHNLDMFDNDSSGQKEKYEVSIASHSRLDVHTMSWIHSYLGPCHHIVAHLIVIVAASSYAKQPLLCSTSSSQIIIYFAYMSVNIHII